MGLQRVPLKDFRGGLNTRDGPFDLQPNESPDLLNVTLTALVGQLEVRSGKTAFSNTSFGNIDHAREFVTPAGARFLMCSIGGWIVSCNSSGVFTNLFHGTPGTVWDFAQMKNAANAELLYCSNGVDAMQKWDGVAGTTSPVAGVPTGTRLLVWRNRLTMIGTAGNPPDTVYFSKVGDPENTSYDTAQLRGDDDDIPGNTEIQLYADRLYVFKKRSVWVMTDPSTLAARRLGEPGCWGRFQSDVCEGKLYWFNEQGIWGTGGVAIEYESGSINTWFPENVNPVYYDKVRMVATRDTYPRILLTVTLLGNTINLRVIELIPHMNFRRIGGRRYLLLPAFLIHDFDASCLAVWKPTATSDWGVYGGSSIVSFKLYRFFDPTTDKDDGANISAHWQSSWLGIQETEPFERVRRLNIEMKGDCQIDVFKDYADTPSFTATYVTDSQWDTGHVWDDGTPWDNTGVFGFRRVRPETRGRFHSVKVSTVGGTAIPFSIMGMELVIRGGKEH